MAAHQAHNLKAVGSIPTPASKGDGMKKIYLASPLGFAESTKTVLEEFKERLEKMGFSVHEPFEQAVQLDAQTNPHKVMTADLKGIDDTDAVFAVLNGEPPDVGVAVEVGYAAAKGKPIFLFRDDFRRCTDSQGFPVNLMLLAGQPEVAFHKNVYTSLDELEDKNKGLWKFYNAS